MATIRPMRDKWQAIVRRKGHPTLTKSFSLRKDAEKWARQQERLIDTGDWVDRTAAKQTTLGDLLDRYLKEVTPAKRGITAESSRIAYFSKQPLARSAVEHIRAKDITAWRDRRTKEVSGSTVAREMQLLGHVFSVAIREWGIPLPANPVSLVRKPSGAIVRDRVLTAAERKNLLVACGQCQNPWIRPVVVFALETAARRSEILALEWRNVDLKRCTAKLIVTKTNQPRTIPLSPSCTAMLGNLPTSIDGKVFPVTVEALRQAYIRAVARAGIKNFTFHDLRHDALTRLAKLGFSVLELRAISGHTTANMLQRYVAIDAEDLAAKLSVTP